MKNKELINKFKENLSYAFIAQSVSLLTSLVMSVAIPKILGTNDFAYWQLFVFLNSYIGLFHLGITDGIYLKYGGVGKKQLSITLIGAQLKVMFVFHVVIACFICFLISFHELDYGRYIVIIFAAVNLVIFNVYAYCGIVFQIINETKKYSVATIIFRGGFLACILFFTIKQVSGLEMYLVWYTIAQISSCFYLIYEGRWFVSSKCKNFHIVCAEIKNNIKVGINLTISNIVSSLILGIGRILVDLSQGIILFGKISYAISLCNFFLQFTAQVSIVLFPILRKIKEDEMIEIYSVLRQIVSLMFCLLYIVFMPLQFLLNKWLPQYADSIEYLIILLPICLFDGKSQILYNTYLKVFRKERQLLLFNILTLIVSTGSAYVTIYILKSTYALLVSMLISITFRSVLESVYLSLYMKIPLENNLIGELVVSLSFVISNFVFGYKMAFGIIIISVTLYCWKNRNIAFVWKQFKPNA